MKAVCLGLWFVLASIIAFGQDASIFIDRQEAKASVEFSFEKVEQVMLQVSGLAPSSDFTVIIKKSGIRLSKQSFKADKKGEIDAQIKIPNQEGKAEALLTYTTSQSNTIEKRLKINIVD